MSALIDPIDEYEQYVMKSKPVLKWAGSKRQLEPAILKAIERLHPGEIQSYYEPFFGGGAIFFALRSRFQIRSAVLSDTNPELINFYLQIQNEPEALILALRKLKKEGHGGEKRYYEVRASKPRSEAARAARFKYINAEGFNGLWRVNKKGLCNVPWGRRVKPAEILDEEAIWAAHHALGIADIEHAPYEKICPAILESGDGTFAYFDPPYWPTRPTANFTAYGPEGFGPEDQQELEGWFDRITKKKIPALLSNSNVPATRSLYEHYKRQRVRARRNINSDGNKRGAVFELLVESTFKK